MKLISVEKITDHHAETYIAIKRKHADITLTEYLGIFSSKAVRRIKKLAKKMVVLKKIASLN